MRLSGEKQGVDYREKVKHIEKTDQLFVKMTMKVDGKHDHRLGAGAAVRLNSDEVMQV